VARTKRSTRDELAHDDAAAQAAGIDLSDRHERFCQEYVIDGNGAAAARRAGYAAIRSRVTAVELLRRPAVQARVRELLAEMTARSEYTREAVLREMGAIAFASLKNVVTIRGGHVYLRKDAEIPPEAWPAIAELSNTEHGIRIKLHNKVGALDRLGQMFKMWEGSSAGRVNLTVRLVRELGNAPNVRKVG
jgi:phage terminase small subunit